MPLQATSGAASYDAFGGGVAAVPQYIEDIFSTTLYTGNGSTQTITNGIDLSTNGGLVWIKARTLNADHLLYDTSRGVNKVLYSNSTVAQDTTTASLTAFNNNGFSVNATGGYTNSNTYPYASWTFRKQPKFFDVVTITSGAGPQTISHNLGSTPGMIVVKRTTGTSDWWVWHRSIPNNALALNTTQSTSTFTNPEYIFGDGSTVVQPTSTQFTFYAPSSGSNTYVAYVFAHDAGGFGLTGTDNVISCGSTTANGSGDFSVTLGYEPQWVLLKSTGSGRWSLFDNMRGVTASSGYTSSKRLQPHLSDAEDQFDAPYGLGVNATGFTGNLATFSNDFIYIAIRRGPMKVPTSGTSVYYPLARSGTGAAATITGVGFPTDLVLSLTRNFSGTDHLVVDRLRGSSAQIFTNLTAAESTNATSVTSLASNDGISVGTDYPIQSINYASGYTFVTNFFRRAPSFFDEVCYTGTGSATTFTHNLAAVPEMMIVKKRSASDSWQVYHQSTAAGMGPSKYMVLNSTAAEASGSDRWNSTNPTSSVFTVGNAPETNGSGATYVAYLFATCAGVSKVGSFTGNGSSQTINCGFTGGARFVMVKATSTTGNWIVADSARGIVAGNDPALYLNSAAAEVTGLDWIDADNSGFVVNETATIAANTNGVSYIFLAIS